MRPGPARNDHSDTPYREQLEAIDLFNQDYQARLRNARVAAATRDAHRVRAELDEARKHLAQVALILAEVTNVRPS